MTWEEGSEPDFRLNFCLDLRKLKRKSKCAQKFSQIFAQIQAQIEATYLFYQAFVQKITRIQACINIFA